MNIDVKRVETLAVVFIILLLLTRVSSLAMEMWTASFLGASRQMEALRAQTHAMATLWSLVVVMVNIGIGMWLFITARSDGRAKWIWALFGLTGGLTAAVLYFLLRLEDTLQRQKDNGEQSSGANSRHAGTHRSL